MATTISIARQDIDAWLVLGAWLAAMLGAAWLYSL